MKHDSRSLLTGLAGAAILLFPASAAAAAPQASGVWESIPSMQDSRNGFGAVASGGRFWVLGGRNDRLPSKMVTTTEFFDPDTMLWSYGPPMPHPRPVNLGAAVGPADEIYLLGGSDIVSATPEVWMLVQGSSSWVPRAPLPTARDGIRAVTDSLGRIYALGGSNQAVPSGSFAERYDPGTDTWEVLPDMPIGRHAIGACIDGLDRVWLFGGSGPGGTHVAQIDRFNPASGSWEVLPYSFPPTGWGEGAKQVQGTVGPDGRFWLCGGWLPGHSSAVDVFDPVSETFQAYSAMPRASNNFGVVSLGGHLYTAGGDGAVATAERTLVVDTVTVDFGLNPRTLNLRSRGNSVTGYLWPVEGGDVFDFLPGTVAIVEIDGVAIPPLFPIATDFQDQDGDGSAETLMVKFDRASLAAVLVPGTNTVVVEGDFLWGGSFVGEDMIRAKS